MKKRYIPTFLPLLFILLSSYVSSSSHSNICTNGKTAGKLNAKDYMREFSNGPCAPVVLVPGVMGSILQITIDCPVLRENDPVTFKNCGWSTCKGEISHSFKSTPHTEYQIWVPDPFSPMSVISSSDNARYCWSHLVQGFYDTTSGKLIPKPKPGVQITIKGLTPETSSFDVSECGTKSVEDLIRGLLDPEATQYLKGTINRLKEMGYRSGLTLQALPYDFRMSVGLDIASRNLGTIVKKLKALNNKKVVIAAHSLGNLKTSYGLRAMTQADKDENIALYVAIAPPYLGAAETVNFLSCGDDEFYKFGFGINMAEWKSAIGTFAVIFELAPYPTYYSQASQPWMQKIMKRIDYENGKSSDPVYPFLPTKDQICYTKFNKKNCHSGLEVFDNFLQYGGKTYGASNYRDWLNEFSFSGITKEAWNTIDSSFEQVTNLGVPIALLYTQILNTEGIFSYKVDPRIPASEDRFCNSKELSWDFWKGDTTVPSTSAVTAGIKWADEFVKGVPGAKPVKLVDICSSYNVKSSPWDGKTSSGARTMEKVEYQGMPCDCDQSHTRHCDHNSLLYLPQFIEYITSSVQTEERVPVSPIVNGMTEAQLEDYQKSCQILRGSIQTNSGIHEVSHGIPTEA